MDNDYYMQFVTKNVFIKENTKLTYITNLKRLSSKVCNAPLHDVIYQPEKYAPIIEQNVKSLDSIKSIITSILVVIRNSDIKYLYQHIYNAWYKPFKRVKQQLARNFVEQKPTDKHTASFVPWEHILEARNQIPYGSKEHLWLSITTMIPPRRQLDWYKVRIYTDPDDKPVHDHNLIHIGYQNPFISLVHYKTAKYFKRWFKQVPKDLLDVIRSSLKQNPREWLFVMRNKEPFTNSMVFTSWSNSVFKKILGNEHVSMNTLRHAYADYIKRVYPEMSLQEKSRIARDMGHSLFSSEGYAHNHNKG
jgi:hypothetical protein